MQKSIEVEYWVIDADGALVEPGALVDHSDQVHGEFVESLFEVKTPPCESMEELRRTFVDQLAGVLDRAAELDRKLVPLATPVNGEVPERVADERGRIQKRVIGENLAFAKHCAGTHIHVEQRNVADQLNVLLALDPALALANSSPYFRGERVADGARAYLYRKLCYEEFPKHGQLWRYVDTVAEWHRRLDRRFEEFREAAVEAGVDAEAVDAHFASDDVVWTPVRLRDAMPTVEWRSPDATLPSEILRLAGDVDRVMRTLHDTTVSVGAETGHVTEEGIEIPAFEPLCDLAEAAIHEGLEASAVVDYLERMGFTVDDYHPISSQIGGRGFVTRADARELRLEYANRLEADVEALDRSLER